MLAVRAYSSHRLELLPQIEQIEHADWSTVIARRAEKKAPAVGGWNLMHATWISPDVNNPAVNIGLSGACDKAWFGWSCSEPMEKLRSDWLQAGDPAQRKRIAEQVQLLAYDEVPYLPWGQYLAQVLATVRTRVGQLLARHRLEPEDDTVPADPLTEASPVLAGLVGASVQGRVALGPRAGARVRRLGDEPDPGHATPAAPARPSSMASISTPMSGSPPTTAPASNGSAATSSAPRSPSTASSSAPDGRVLVQLKTMWRAGTSHLLFEPVELLEKLAAITPRPTINLVLYHGVLAPRARWRAQVVPYGRPAPSPNVHA